MEACTSVGQPVTPDPTALCSVLLNTPARSSLNVFVSWKDLAVTSCAVLDGASTYCYLIDSSGGTQRSRSAAAVVGFDILFTGRRRQLLEKKDHHASFWESEEATLVAYMLHNASWTFDGTELCRDLVHAYRVDPAALGVLDRHALKECLHWRLITNHTVAVYNWTEAPGDMFTLSWHGIAQALVRPKFVLQVWSRPAALGFLLSHLEWAEPFANLFTAIDNYMVYALHHLDAFAASAAASASAAVRPENSTTAAGSPPSSPPPTPKMSNQVASMIDRHKRFARNVMPFMHTGSVYISSVLKTGAPPSSSLLQNNDTLSNIESVIDLVMVVHGSGGRRHLLVANDTADWKIVLRDTPLTYEIGAVQAYSALIAGGGVLNAPLSAQIANAWLDGPFQWPPLDRTNFGVCPTGTVIQNVLVRGFSALGNQILNPKPVAAYEKQRLNDTLPRLWRYNGTILVPTGGGGGDALVRTTLNAAKSFLLELIDIRVIVGFVVGSENPPDGAYSATKVVKQLLTCNFETVLDCSGKRANTAVGALAVVGLLAGLYMAFGSLGAFVLGGVSMPLLILWYVYGYSPACVPMIPQCVVKDFLSMALWFIPLQFQWPLSLQKIPGCAASSAVPFADCFISCAELPFGYTSWEASVAWAACDWDPQWCAQTVAPWALRNNLVTLWSHILNKQQVSLLKPQHLCPVHQQEVFQRLDACLLCGCQRRHCAMVGNQMHTR